MKRNKEKEIEWEQRKSGNDRKKERKKKRKKERTS